MATVLAPSAESLASLQVLAPSFARSLRAQNKSVRTVVGYLEGVRLFAAFAEKHRLPPAVASITREHVEMFVADQLARWRPATAWTRFRSLQQFFRWLCEEGEIRESPMRNMKPPAIPDEPPPVLTEADLKKLLATCDGRAKRPARPRTDTYVDRRDLAIMRMLLDTGIRLSELAGLKVEDIDLDSKTALVMGKGRRPRTIAFGDRTARDIDRYLRLRHGRDQASLPNLWLGLGGPMTDSGIRQMIEVRAKQAGIEGVHPHRFRHTFAHLWLSSGGQEGDLMRLAGWRSRAMLTRYGASAASERAREAHKALRIGDRV